MSSSRILVPALAVLAAIPLAAMDSSDVQIHGFASQGYLSTSHNNIFGDSSSQGGTFDFNEFGVNFTSTPVDRLRIGAQIFAQNLGKFGKGKPSIDWAYGEYEVPTSSSALGVKFAAGRVKINHGLYGDYRDLDMTRTTTMLPESVYPSAYRDLLIAVNGAMATADLSAGVIGSFRVHGFLGGQTVDNEGLMASNFLGFSRANELKNIQVERAEGGGLEWHTPFEGLRVKGSVLEVKHMVASVVSYTVSPTPGAPPGRVGSVPWKLDLTDYRQFIVGAEYQVGDLTVASEYLNEYVKVVREAVLGAPQYSGFNRQQGAYALIGYRFHPQWELALQSSWMYQKNPDFPPDSVANFRRMGGLALRFDPTDHWLIKAEFQRNRGTLALNGTNDPNGVSEYWNLFALKTTFDF